MGGLVPAVLLPLRDTQKHGTILLSLQSKQIDRLLRRHKTEYAKTQPIELAVPSEHAPHFRGWGGSNSAVVPAVFRTFEFDPVTSATLSVTLQVCPPGSEIKMRVPVSIFGQDSCSAIKKGGYLYPVRPFVECRVCTSSLPVSIEYNI